MSGKRPLPLADISVLAVEQYGAGPFGSLLLADLGAEVIKVEDASAGGDVGRHVPPYEKDGANLFFESLNRNKRSICLDLGNAAGQRAFRGLVANVDAVYCNLRGDVPEQLGLTYSQLADANQRIVCCSLSAFGMTGRMRRQPGYDYLLQGMAGWMSLTGEPDGPPTKSGLSLVDFSTGYAAALALLAGVHSARRDGEGMDCDVALFDVALGMLNYLATWHLTAGYNPPRTSQSAHPTLIPFQNFKTADGWVVLGCAKEKFWVRLIDVLDEPELRDHCFADFAGRATNAGAVLAILGGILCRETTEHWLSVFTDAGVPCAPVLTVAEALAAPLARERDMVLGFEHPAFGEVRSVANPVKVGSRTREPEMAPRLGEHTSEVLAGVGGFPKQAIDELWRLGAFGDGSEQRLDDPTATAPGGTT